MNRTRRACVVLLCAAGAACSSAPRDGLVIAHRGASGYLPEHTLEAYAAGYFAGADYIEQDCVMTRDDELVLLHDHTLDRTTDVAQRFPDRYRMADGEKRWFVVDFTLAEVKSLRVTERFEPEEPDEPGVRPVFPGRFPLGEASFEVPTLQEAIELVQGLNRSTGRDVGIYPEIKAPWWFRDEGKDLSRAVLEVLKDYGYAERQDRIYLQCFDPNELRRIDTELMPELRMDLKLVQLIAENDWEETFEEGPGGELVPYDYSWMFETGGMRRVAAYADGIGPWLPMVVDEDASYPGHIVVQPLVGAAREVGLEIHPFTLRLDPGKIPDYAEDFDDLLRVFFDTAGVNGVFTDFPDRAVRFLRRNPSR